MYILKLKDIKRSNYKEVGGKAANLGKLKAFKVRVPNGFCICFNAYKEFIEVNGLDVVIHEYTEKNRAGDLTIDQCSEQIMKCFADAPMPSEIAKAVAKEYKLLKIRSVAVRSSANTEDLKEASFAGQQDTFLNVTGFDNVLKYIKMCWASLWTTRSIVYRQKEKYDVNNVYLAVIIQEMLQPDISGVAFTYNPVNNAADEVLINASYGLGEAVASGLITPDTYVYNIYQKRIVSREKGGKEFRFINSKSGVKKVHNSAKRRKVFSLSLFSVIRLAILCKKIEKYFDYPQDIEWAIQHNKIYILQSRPITTIS